MGDPMGIFLIPDFASGVARMRPSDTPVICCNHDKLTRDTGWRPELGIDAILANVLEEWRKKV